MATEWVQVDGEWLRVTKRIKADRRCEWCGSLISPISMRPRGGPLTKFCSKSCRLANRMSYMLGRVGQDWSLEELEEATTKLVTKARDGKLEGFIVA